MSGGERLNWLLSFTKILDEEEEEESFFFCFTFLIDAFCQKNVKQSGWLKREEREREKQNSHFLFAA